MIKDSIIEMILFVVSFFALYLTFNFLIYPNGNYSSFKSECSKHGIISIVQC